MRLAAVRLVDGYLMVRRALAAALRNDRIHERAVKVPRAPPQDAHKKSESDEDGERASDLAAHLTQKPTPNAEHQPRQG